jgi:acyl-CoA thioester hydrolase
VQFHETDAAGIVHFSCFFRYMEEAEHALWREAGLSIARGRANVGFPRVAAGFDFHRPLRFEDEFDVCIRIAAIDEKTIRYTCLLTRNDDKIATGTLTIICVSKRADGPMKAMAIPPEIADRFEVAAGDGS